ncbi:uncharacterized protein LOC119689051 [Teleopsis dalmanni]|uniref:uncharacterized protein LOC119689051 n=1 Tax=Teleopsis dalmanni TaxID=139649 RepID=UPI0018CECB9A|nr:uncharacterized protein LOC119689051 [Teleopsis dalmanni]
MGAPELPNDIGDEKISDYIVHQQPIPNEDSDNEDQMNTYEGYELLDDNDTNMGRNVSVMDDDDDDECVEDSNMETNSLDAETERLSNDPNLPNIEAASIQIARQLWSEPRPKELQLELDNKTTEQILNVMANITLPSNITIPDWATNIPEERWKQDLLQRIRQRKEEPANTNDMQKKLS